MMNVIVIVIIFFFAIEILFSTMKALVSLSVAVKEATIDLVTVMYNYECDNIPATAMKALRQILNEPLTSDIGYDLILAGPINRAIMPPEPTGVLSKFEELYYITRFPAVTEIDSLKSMGDCEMYRSIIERRKYEILRWLKISEIELDFNRLPFLDSSVATMAMHLGIARHNGLDGKDIIKPLIDGLTQIRKGKKDDKGKGILKLLN